MHANRTYFPIRLYLIVFLIVTISQRGFLSAREASGDLWIVSVPNLKLSHGERVIGFEVTLTAARIVSLLDIPLEWYISIDNESWQATMRGGIVVGAAALDEKFLKDFIIIERRERLAGMEGAEFDIRIEVITTIDFENVKRILLKEKDLLLQKK